MADSGVIFAIRNKKKKDIKISIKSVAWGNKKSNNKLPKDKQGIPDSKYV